MENQQQSPSRLIRDKKDTEDNKLIAAIGYLGILCLLPLLLKKDSAYAQFHGKQSLVLLITWVIIFFLNVIPVIGWLTWSVLSVVFFIFMVMGIMNSLQGNYWKMPILGEYAKKIKL